MDIIRKRNGFGTIEAVILIAVLIGLAVIFRSNIIRFVEMVFDAVFKNAGEILNSPGIIWR